MLVIGGGIAGISASYLLGTTGRKVYLVEKEAALGGKVSGYEKVYPDMMSGKTLTEKYLNKIMKNENIEVLTETVVEKVLGFFGNFVVTTQTKNSESDHCLHH